jgi:cell division protein FtsI (penicillin-binding protein 3)
VTDRHGNRLATAAAAVAARLGLTGSRQHVARREPAVPGADWRRTMRARLMVCAVVFAAWTVAIEARLVYLQVYEHSAMQALANRQQLRTMRLPPRRGEIFDRNGRLLAYSVDADTIAADPSEVQDPAEVARAVCGAIRTCTPDLERGMTERLRRRDRQFAYLARWISPPDAARVRALELEGLIMLRETKRYYPKRDLAAHVLGFVGAENSGLAGLESRFDSRIRGQEGRLLVQADARQRAMAVREQQLPTAGDALELTIDQYLQHIAERELRAAVEATNAVGGTIIVMEPHTGDVLALANWPTYNPNAFGGADADTRRNRAVQEIYEPGSTFKIVTASAALEEGVLGPDDPIDCAPGYITFPGRKPIRDVNRYGVLSFTDVIVKSSNVGAIKAGLQLGPERMVRYMTRFGFGQRLAPDFRGESPGIVWRPQSLDASALASVSMGYQVSVTPLQMAAAVSAIANGGTLFEPRVVRAFIHDGRREEAAPKAIRRAITPETAATVTMMMEEVVVRGTARAARIPGFTVAGKTGTAARLVNGGYSKTDYNASFVGFVPSRHPALAIVVVIDTPRRGPGTHYYGGVAAAPVFQRVAAASLRHLGVAPNLNAAPPILVARNPFDDDELAPRPAHAPAVIESVADLVEPGVMPDLRGLSAREAVRELMRLGLTPRLEGDGFVLGHDPQPGDRLAGGETAELTLGRRPPSARAGGPSR